MKNKKIGILTFHRAANYGAVLQAYALENAILKIDENVQVEVVDYRCRKIEDSYALFNPNTDNLLKELLRMFFCLRKRWVKRCIFDAFIDKYLILSSKIYNRNSIKTAENDYDVFVSGSDQVWNDILTGNDMTYCLDFVKESEKRYSYAASLGNTSGNKLVEAEYMSEIEKFRGISVRENETLVRMESLGRKDITVSPDPTLLLTKEKWLDFAKLGKKPDKPYILVYELTPGIKLVEFAKNLAAEKGMEILYLNESYIRFRELKHLRGVTPVDFVSLIANAGYMVTNSFHGTVFSVLCNTNFFVETEAEKSVNNRILHLLDIFQLQSRDISRNDGLAESIDWQYVNELKATISESAETYLKEIVG